MKKLTMDFLVGLFVILAILSLSFLALKTANLSTILENNNDYYILYANFSNIGSLKDNAPIKVSGFTVGRVQNISLNLKTYQAMLTLKINNKYKFSTDTTAQILTTGLLGEQYLALQSGADENYLKNGDFISITSSAMVLENLITKLITNIAK